MPGEGNHYKIKRVGRRDFGELRGRGRENDCEMEGVKDVYCYG